MDIQSDTQLEQVKAELESNRMMQEAQIKMNLLEKEYQLKMQLEQMGAGKVEQKEVFKENRKDERTKIQATQQSEMIDQRNWDKPPKNFQQSQAEQMM